MYQVLQYLNFLPLHHDAIGESSDIAALDTWRGGSPKGEDEGFNAAVMRTKKGIKVFNEAVESGYLIRGDKVTIEDIKDFQPHQTSKKQASARYCINR